MLDPAPVLLPLQLDLARWISAATLAPTYGIYSGFELCENVAVRAGSDTAKAAIEVLDALGVLEPAELEALEAWRHPVVRNHAGRDVGRIEGRVGPVAAGCARAAPGTVRTGMDTAPGRPRIRRNPRRCFSSRSRS